MDSPSSVSSCYAYSRPKGSNMDQSIQDLVAATLAELGLLAPTNLIQTMLMKDRYFVGWKFRYDGGHAIRWAGGDTLEFYDECGTLLKTVAIGEEKGAAAYGRIESSARALPLPRPSSGSCPTCRGPFCLTR